MELQYKQQPLQNNLKSASYASGGLQSHTWELQWVPQGLEQAIKRIGMSLVITQNFSTDPMGRILSMTYNGASYNGELYFHYDVQGNTSLLTDSNGQAVASFRYDLHSGKLVEYWNPNSLELVNLKNGRQGSIRITTAVTCFNRDLYIQPWPPIEINPLPTNGNGNGGEWGGIGAVIGGGAFVDMRAAPDTEKDCMSASDRFNLCMARCFTFGVDEIGDLNTPRSTDSFAFENISNFHQAMSDFKDFALDRLGAIGATLLALIGGILFLVSSLGGGKIAASVIATLKKIGSTLGVAGTSIHLARQIRRFLPSDLYDTYSSSLSKVRMIDGAWYSPNLPSTVESDTDKLIRGFNHYTSCADECMKLVYGGKPF